MDKNVECVVSIVTYLFDALILMWLCKILLPIVPALALFAGLTFWSWVGILLGIHVIARNLAKIMKAVWAK